MIRFRVWALICLLGASTAQASRTETYVGVGISITRSRDLIRINDVIPGGPAEKAGITAGEWLLAVDQRVTARMDLDEVVNLIEGDAGTTVILSVRKGKEGLIRNLPLVRAQVVLECVVEGNIRATLFGNPSGGTIQGQIGNDPIFLNVFQGRATGRIGNESVSLNLLERFAGMLSLSGWIRSTYVDWSGSASQFTGYQPCIR